MTIREHLADTLLGKFRAPPPADRRPQLEADIANTLVYARSYESRGISLGMVLKCWAAGYSVEQVEAHADQTRGRG